MNLFVVVTTTVTSLQRIRQVKFIIDIAKIIWTKEEYELEASRITTGRVLRGIVNQSHSNGKSQSNSDRNMIKGMRNSTSFNKAIRNTKNNMLSSTNRYEVLENYDDVEGAETGTKSTT